MSKLNDHRRSDVLHPISHHFRWIAGISTEFLPATLEISRLSHFFFSSLEVFSAIESILLRLLLLCMSLLELLVIGVVMVRLVLIWLAFTSLILLVLFFLFRLLIPFLVIPV